MDLVVTVADIRGKCSAYQMGDTFTLKEGYLLVSDVPVCMHALSALMPFYNALRVSSPEEWKLAGKKDKSKAYVQCPDAATHTGGGCVVFEIAKSE
ncbi:MAG: TIGR04076 family protein [Candidatus Eiseniibacteriota bacterium]|nr:MAG: TIGR04076 family protein [Candidatus Eisenbacteria bacterium]